MSSRGGASHLEVGTVAGIRTRRGDVVAPGDLGHELQIVGRVHEGGSRHGIEARLRQIGGLLAHAVRLYRLHRRQPRRGGLGFLLHAGRIGIVVHRLRHEHLALGVPVRKSSVGVRHGRDARRISRHELIVIHAGGEDGTVLGRGDNHARKALVSVSGAVAAMQGRSFGSGVGRGCNCRISFRCSIAACARAERSSTGRAQCDHDASLKKITPRDVRFHNGLP